MDQPKRMNWWSIRLLLLSMIVFAGCEEPYANHELLGKWRVVRMNDGESDTLYQIGPGNIYQYDFFEDGAFQFTAIDPLFNTVGEGTWEAHENVLIVSSDEGSDVSYDYSIIIDTLRLEWQSVMPDDVVLSSIWELERQ